MEAEARYTYVGAAILLLVLALVAAVIWLRNAGQQENYDRYTIYFEKQRIDGLQIDGDVDMRGVKVGRVVSFELADYQQQDVLINRVRVVVSISKRAPVRTNTVAIITRNFVTGIAQVSLVTPDTEGSPLTVIADNEQYPVIAEGRSDLDEIAGKVGRLGDMAGEIMGNLNRMLSDDNREAFALTMKNLATMTEQINQRMDSLERTLNSVSDAADSVDRAGDRVTAFADDAGGEIRSLVTTTRDTIARAEQAMQDVSRAVATLEKQGQTLTARVDRTGAELTDQVSAAVAELRLSLESAAVTLDRLQDPRAAILGAGPAQLGPGEEMQ
ncbi:MAG: MCE family protein [Pseudomonadales bacterium]|nr:MCE family protein [Pseudomonadales bacterium]MCP5185627.1 MCE family protein [Pseudomonadales bacterium]